MTEAAAGIPASYAQESLVRGADASAVTVPAVVRFSGPVGIGRIRAVLAELTDRHDALRTVLTRTADGRVLQRVHPAVTLPLTVTKHRESPERLLPELLLSGSDAPFRLTGSLLARAELHTGGAAGQLLLIWMHHAVSDLISSRLLAEEFGTLLARRALGPLGRSPARFALEERAVRPTTRQWDFWSRTLEGADLLLGVDHPAGLPHQAVRPALPRLSPSTVEGLERLAAARRTTLTTVLAAAVFAAHAGDATAGRAAIGLTVSNRDHPRLRSTVGCLADQLPLAVDLGGRPTFGELVGRVREALIDAYDHRLPLGVLLPLLGRTEPPVFGVNLNFLPPPANQPLPPAPDLPYGLTKRRAEPWWLGDAGLAYRPRIDGAGLAGEIEGDVHLQGAAEVGRRGERFCALLAAVATDPGLDVRTLAGVTAGRG
ncbi:MAG TPA: condensation domain-containing protein [Mycobacteriales bacterium]